MSRSLCRIVQFSRCLRAVSSGYHFRKCSTIDVSSKVPSSLSFGDLSLKVLAETKTMVVRDENDILEEQTIDEFVEKSIALLKQRLAPGAWISPNTGYNMGMALEKTNKLYRNHWLKLLIARPEIFSFPSDKFQCVILFVEILLVKYEVKKGTAFKLVSTLPESFIFQQEKSHEDLERNWDTFFFSWFGFCNRYGIDENEALSIIITSPEVALYETTELFDQINNLKSDYFHDKAVLRELLLTAASAVFFEPWESLSQKLDYLIKTMYVDIRTLSRHGYVLNENLENIKVRFLFLDRAGLYERPSPKAMGTSFSASPAINLIVEPSDEDFVLKTVGHGLTLEEFLTFRDMILSEEESFRNEREKLWYSEIGYEDAEYREDLEQEQVFQSNHSKPVIRPKRKPLSR